MGIDLERFKSKKDDEWADWLADDPVPAGLRARMREKAVEEASRPVVRRVGQPQTPVEASHKQTSKPTGNHSISIHISVPKFEKAQFKKLPSRLRAKLPKELPYNLTYKKVGIGGGALISVLVVGVIALSINSHKGSNTGEKGVLSASDQKATFATLKPSNKNSKPSNERYDGQKKVASYVDSIGGVDITVSQQQLPGGFEDNTDEKVKKLAADFSATEVISTANPTAYLGNDIRGPQTVIFSKKGLLVFIFSVKAIDTHDWASYITGLE